jgi:ABC-type sugar transport system ATPase subunit
VGNVRYEAVSKNFNDVSVLTNFDLRVANGEFMVLLGPSGSGKTTALRILAGLEPLSDGHVWIGDRRVEDLPPRARDIAMVFQDYALYPQMSVYENMAFGLKVKRVPKGEIRQRVEDASQVLGISELLKRKPAALSGGQRQRVALGRALVRDPAVFLMDEPLSNLDAKLRAQTRGEIRRLQKERGHTTLYVTHDQVEAMTMGDRVAILHDGQLEQVADARTVYEEPANAFVGGFLGSPAMAFGHFGVRSSAKGVELVCGTVCLAIPGDLPRRSDNGDGSAVLVGVRPEDARPWDGSSDLIGPLEGRVESVEALGRETFVGVRANEQLCFTAQVPGERRMDLGDQFQFGLKRGKIHIFSVTEGLALGRL